MDKLDFLVKKALSRRAFVAGAGSVAAASVVAGCSDDGTVTLPTTSTGYSDVDILNFALNTEYLEAEFYVRAATGTGLPTTLIGSSPGTVNAPATTKVPGATTAQQNMMDEIAYTEQLHISAIRAAITALGGTPISRPTIDFVAGFTGVVTAANNISSSASPTIPTNFSPFTSFDTFALVSGGFEDLGVTAYSGAAPLLSATAISAGVLAAAGGILAKEAYTAGMMRSYVTANAITQGSTAYPYAGYFNRLALLYSTLGGSGNSVPLAGFGTSAVTVGNATASQVVPVNSNALAPSRTFDQVLHIVYGTATTSAGAAAGISSGLFFPSGLNGNIKTTQS